VSARPVPPGVVLVAFRPDEFLVLRRSLWLLERLCGGLLGVGRVSRGKLPPGVFARLRGRVELAERRRLRAVGE